MKQGPQERWTHPTTGESTERAKEAAAGPKERAELSDDILKSIPERSTLNMEAYTVKQDEKGVLDVLKRALPHAFPNQEITKLAYRHLAQETKNEINFIEKGDVIELNNGELTLTRVNPNNWDNIKVDLFPFGIPEPEAIPEPKPEPKAKKSPPLQSSGARVMTERQKEVILKRREFVDSNLPPHYFDTEE